MSIELKVEFDITEAMFENANVDLEILLKRYYGADALVYPCKGGSL